MTALQLPQDHPDRDALGAEVHARPPMPVVGPARVTYLAVLIDPVQRAQENAHLHALCVHFGVSPPADGATHFSGQLRPGLRVKWERHGEFSGYTFYATGADQELGQTAVEDLQPGWLQSVPGRTVAALSALVWKQPIAAVPSPAELSGWFGDSAVAGSEVAEGAAFACTDFRTRDDGFTRVVLLDRSLTPYQTGRILQRLFEIEAYRMMALLALPIARRQSPRILDIERSLAALTDGIASGEHDPASDETLLQQLTRLAAEIESGLSASQFRFGACRAYADLVSRRIQELREQRAPGLQTLEEFMSRRFQPAVATCQTVSQRLHDLSERVAQASGLLRTRVEIARERQNQQLLASMDKRARMQLRLQQTVEGLSVAAISYYVAGLVGYAAKGLRSAGWWDLDPDIAVGVSVPVVVLLFYLAMRRARRHVLKDMAD
jgi:uncharacterized membrane-anchored protein